MGRFDALLNTSKPQTAQKSTENTPSSPENLKSRFHENLNSGNTESMNAGKQVNTNSRKPENLKTRKPDFVKAEKYSTLIDPKLKKEIQVFALEHDMKDYEVIQSAVREYLN